MAYIQVTKYRVSCRYKDWGFGFWQEWFTTRIGDYRDQKEAIAIIAAINSLPKDGSVIRFFSNELSGKATATLQASYITITELEKEP